MGALEFLNGFVEVDYRIEKGEYVCAKSGYVVHGVIMSVEYGEEIL